MKIETTEMNDLLIKQDDLTDPRVQDLIALHLQAMHSNSPKDSVYALDLSSLQNPDVTVWTVWKADDVTGMGALHQVDDVTGELKSMRTHPDFLRMGVAGRLLEHIIKVAKSRGYKRLCLETGSGEAFDPALQLYRNRGFVSCDAFGDYRQSDFNQFMDLQLGQ